MSIEFSTVSSTASSSVETEVELDSTKLATADPNDIHAFENSLHHDPFSDGIMSKIETVSGSLSDMRIDFEKSLKKAAETANPTDILDSMRKLSDYTLQTSMVAKTAGKTSQAVYKLTNLH